MGRAGRKLVPVHQTAEYKEALQWMRKIYEDGLVRPDWATVDTSTWEDGCKKGEAGCFLDTMDGAKRIWNYFTSNNVASVVDPSHHRHDDDGRTHRQGCQQ